MATYTSPIKARIEDTSSEELPLDMLREAIKNTKPDLVRAAAEEFAAIGVKLDTMIEILDTHLKALDKSWTVGEDAKQVKAQLRRLRDSAASVRESISDGDKSRCATRGIGPALAAYSDTLRAFRGDPPDKAGSDISTLEAAGQWGMGGAGIGFMVGGPPGAVIGGVIGTIAGGITSLFSDVPFLNMVGESKQEKEQKAANKFLRELTKATVETAHWRFPESLKTDIPQFTVPQVKVKDLQAPGGVGPGGLPGLSTKAYDPTLGKGPDGLDGSGLDGLGEFDGDGPDGSDVDDIDLDGRAPDGSDLGGGVTGSGPDGKIQTVDPGAGDIDGDPGSVDGSSPPDGADVKGAGFDGKGGNTSLAGYDPSMSQVGDGTTPFGTTGTGSSSGGSGSSGGTSGGAAGVVQGAGAGVRASASGGTPGIYPPPASGSKTEQKERDRTTWLLEDDDLFSSDAKVTIHRIDDVSKDRA
ncbi:WXG100 family type VII secretion target [Nonomuraea africana]|uniref:WXG100 family type VII secretion target n=1 Tax=Nonomuraea africana TaxID=46171 RepID=A0ABR9KV65_9ACTN|nr:hypothetical protein [Nonomuraea africana]MBE1565620.1 hypothetical protein [Nonomuraea africana]